MFLLQLAQMLVVSFVCQVDQPLVEELLAHTAFRTTAENDGFSFRVEGKGEPHCTFNTLMRSSFMFECLEPSSVSTYKTGINKHPIATVNVTLTGVETDAVCDRRYHGGLDQAVYVEGGRSLEQWGEELGLPIQFGQFGENLVIDRLDNIDVAVGDRLEIGEVVLEATAPRMPCSTFAAKMEDPHFVKKYLKAGRPGLYCRVIRPGTLTKAMGVGWEPFAGASILMPQVMRDYGKTISGDKLATYLSTPIHTKLRASLSLSGKVKF